jgi:hypothetical protein
MREITYGVVARIESIIIGRQRAYLILDDHEGPSCDSLRRF